MKHIILALASLTATPALANDIDFKACDGFKVPSATSDGTASSWSLYVAGRAPGESAEQAALASCDAALADPLLLPQFTLRRFLLLRAKAAHQLALKHYDAALGTLDRADGALPQLSGPKPSSSYASGNAVLRAYADYGLGKVEAARHQMARFEAQPGYQIAFLDQGVAMRLSYEHGWDQVRLALRSEVPVNPRRIDQLFWAALYYGDFAEALRVRSQISLTLPHGRDDHNIQGIENLPYVLVTAQADYTGATAYARAAMGDGEAARAMIAQARAAVAVTPVARNGRADLQRRQTAVTEANARLDLWNAAIALRERASSLTTDALVTEIREGSMDGLPILLDLIGQLRPASPSEQSMRDEAHAAFEQRRDREMSGMETFDFATLFQMLPRPVQGPGPWAAGDGFIFDDTNGFYIRHEQGSPYVTIRYGSLAASPGAINDLALLAAAAAVRRDGKDSFLIDSRQFLERAIETGRHSVQSNGAEVRMRILPINAAELTAGQEAMRWRLIHVQDLLDDIGPLYPQLPSRKR